jgi:hypothetical protein
MRKLVEALPLPLRVEAALSIVTNNVHPTINQPIIL